MQVEALSHTARHIALGGAAGAPKQLAQGCRWIGGSSAEIDSHLIRKGTEGTESGKIQGLNFHFSFIQKISGLDQVAAHLRSLDLSSNNIREIEGLQGMKQLRELKLYGCQLSRIQNLDSCPSLIALHLEDNQITSVDGLDGCRGLEYLNLDSNRIQSVSRGLARLTKLKELHLSSNRISSLEGLAGLGSLEVLGLNNNQIQKIEREHLKGLAKVDEVQLAGNQLSSLSFLAASASASSGMQPLPSLSSLDVSSNKLTADSIRGLPPLSQLTDLNLADNQISELPSGIASSLPSIELLDISKNQLERPSQLEELKPLVALRELILEGNPLNSVEDESELPRALAALADLEYVDEKKVLALPPPPEIPALADQPDAAVFMLTASKIAPGSEATTSASTAGGSRPGTGGSRPSTSSSRPSTTQSMKDAGVQNPLMHMRVKQGEKRFASEEQALQWEKQTMNGLAAVEKQIQKTEQMSEKELQRMEKYLQKAQKLFQRQREMHANGYPCPSVPEEPDDDDDLRNSPAKSSRRLRDACISARVDAIEEEDEEDMLLVSASATPSGAKAATPSNAVPVSIPTPSSASAPASRPNSGKHAPPPAFDEEIEEEDTGASTPRAASEVDEDDLGGGVASEREDKAPTGPVELRVGVRAAARTKRSGSNSAAGRGSTNGGAAVGRRPPLPAAQRSERVGAPPRSR